MTDYSDLDINKIALKLNLLSEEIDELDRKHKIPFFYRTYEMREFQWSVRQKLVAEFNPMFRHFKARGGKTK